MKKENTKLEDIKALVKRGMSFAVALTLAGTMSACDEPNLPDETTDPSFGITEPSDTTPGNTETTNPGDTETNPESSETETETQPTEPELSEEDKAFLQNFYQELAQHDARYAEGIGNIRVSAITNEKFGEFNEDNKDDIHHYNIKISFSEKPNIYTDDCFSCNISTADGLKLIELGQKFFEIKQNASGITIKTNALVSNENPIEFYKLVKSAITQLEQEQQ